MSGSLIVEKYVFHASCGCQVETDGAIQVPCATYPHIAHHLRASHLSFVYREAYAHESALREQQPAVKVPTVDDIDEAAEANRPRSASSDSGGALYRIGFRKGAHWMRDQLRAGAVPVLDCEAEFRTAFDWEALPLNGDLRRGFMDCFNRMVELGVIRAKEPEAVDPFETVWSQVKEKVCIDQWSDVAKKEATRAVWDAALASKESSE